MKRCLSCILFLLSAAILALPACASAADGIETQQNAVLMPILIFFFVTLAVLIISCILFSVIGKRSKRGSKSWRVLLILDFLVTAMVIVCTVFCCIQYAVLRQAENTPAASTASTATPSETTEATTLPSTEAPTAETTVPPTEPDPTIAPSMHESADPANWNIEWEVSVAGEITDTFVRTEAITFGEPDTYYPLPGISTFRGNNYRTVSSYGYADITEKTTEKIWSDQIGSLGEWTGVGWTGQPLMVQWDNETKAIMNLYDHKKEKEGLVEVICTTLDGYIYFYDLEDGSKTRDPLWIGMSFKGTASLDPRGYPILYAGSGIPGSQEPRMYIISLIDTTVIWDSGGADTFANRWWFAFDSSPMISAETDTLIWPGECGVLYTIKLNTAYDKATGTLTMTPDTVVKARYATNTGYAVGYESSCVVVDHYVYIGDNGGMLFCVDLDTMEPKWAQNTKDDINSTPVFEWGDDGIGYLYVGTSMEMAGGTSYIYKINANTGEIVWTKSYGNIIYDKAVSGGILSSPVLGRKGTDLEGLIIYPVAKTPAYNSGTLCALDTATGEVVWEEVMENYAWSSPVDVYTQDGMGYLFLCDSVGNLHMIEGTSGQILYTEGLGSTTEASPAVFNNTLVVGTRGQQIFGIQIH